MVLDGAHVLLHLANWETYQHADPAALADRMAHPAVIDARGTFNATAWRRAGWSITALGTK